MVSPSARYSDVQHDLAPSVAGRAREITAFDTTAMVIIAISGHSFLCGLWRTDYEKGLGNGVSIAIFAGIMAGIPGVLARFLDTFGQSPDDFSTISFCDCGAPYGGGYRICE